MAVEGGQVSGYALNLFFVADALARTRFRDFKELIPAASAVNANIT